MPVLPSDTEPEGFLSAGEADEGTGFRFTTSPLTMLERVGEEVEEGEGCSCLEGRRLSILASFPFFLLA